MKILMLFLLLMNMAFAFDADDVDVNKEDLIKAINAMRESGQFSEEDIQKALEEVNGMSEDEIDRTVARGKAMKDNPNIKAAASNVKLDKSEMKRINYDPKSIEKDLEKLKEVMDNAGK
jgi:hypothetical protein